MSHDATRRSKRPKTAFSSDQRSNHQPHSSNDLNDDDYFPEETWMEAPAEAASMSNTIVDTTGKERFRAPVASMISRTRNEPADSITVNAYNPLNLNDGQTHRTSNSQAMGPPAADSIAQSPPLLSQLSPQAESLPKLSHDGLPRNGENEETIVVIEPHGPSIASIQETNRPAPSALENQPDLNSPPILAAPPVTAPSTSTTNHTPTLRKPRLVYLLFKQANVPDDVSNALPRKTLKGLTLPGFFELLSRKHPQVYRVWLRSLHHLAM
ncbi:hypothetical protein M430DRAFT_52767 [Amorphotheca resinae ATCC 22711]|uniref:Uncharacterized protein n=1 Tax=Amorphotheca resinae ATCC 22711 TaxID=857342 RepID=A0A2T3AUX3_AMORE|nr:hypothetical protein M430DRAFT_52767 [Amorphotheca resinae ATCC 22711]PSS12470.1 hypothetical protein M430DRAFT_52767 [Amorphotheca resinae ATCC 22711]